MVTITISNIAPIKPGTKTRMLVKKLKDTTYEALKIVDFTSGIEYHSTKFTEKIEEIRALDLGFYKLCFEIKKTNIYTNKTWFNAKEIECE